MRWIRELYSTTCLEHLRSARVNPIPYIPFKCDVIHGISLANLLLTFFQPAHKQEWGFHNARVNCVAFSPNSLLVASGSLDTTIIIWYVNAPAKHTIIKSKLLRDYRLRVWIYNLNLFSQTPTPSRKSPVWFGSTTRHWSPRDKTATPRYGTLLRLAPKRACESYCGRTNTHFLQEYYRVLRLKALAFVSV